MPYFEAWDQVERVRVPQVGDGNSRWSISWNTDGDFRGNSSAKQTILCIAVVTALITINSVQKT